MQNRQSHVSVGALLVVVLASLVGARLDAADSSSGSYDRVLARARFHRPAAVPQPKDNVGNAERVALGKSLFFDPRLSASNAISCASCHNPAFSWGDGLPRGIGHGSKPVGRRTPTILNTAFAELLFWDGRAGSLEEQALGPIAAPGEMNLPIAEMTEKLRAIAGYAPMFAAAYPGEGITSATVAKAIAAFERTVISPPAPFDAWVEGREDAIPEAAKRGFDLFNTSAACVKCHDGWNFTDNGFHDIGVRGDDLGRGKILPGIEVTQHAFKTPTLRNVDQRAPYMHDGSEPTLAAVIEFYDRGGDVRRPGHADFAVKPLGLTEAETQDLLAFLNTLTSPATPVAIPVLPNHGAGIAFAEISAP